MLPQKLPWEKIKRISLLGTDRANLPKDINELLQNLGIDLDQNEDQVLLAGITKLGLAYRAARKHPIEALKKSEEIGTTKSKVPPMEVAQMLPAILKGDYGDMLPEYLACLQIRNWSFPPDQLPDFLNECIERPELWTKVKDHIGPSAYWLIEMNKDWHRLKKTPKEKKWRSKFPADKLQYFRYIRDIDPMSANELLKEQWATFTTDLKASFLNIISEAPTELDYELLDQLKLGKGKKVAMAVFKIQRHNPNSVIHKKANEFLNRNISFKKKLKVTLPGLDDAADMDLIVNHPEFSGGLKANYLSQILASISLKELEEYFKKTPSEIIKLIDKNEWSFSFYQAMIIRCIEENNQAWSQAMFFHYQETSELIPWNESRINEIYSILDEDSFIEIMNSCASKGPKVVDKESPFIDLLINYPRDWPNEATFAFFKLIKKWIQKNPRFWEGWYIWQVLQKAAFRIDPMQLGVMQKAFQADETWSLAEDEINKFLEVLSFRYRLYKSYP